MWRCSLGVAVVFCLHAQVNVFTGQYDNARSGANQQETVLNTTNVNAAAFGKLFSRGVDGFVYAQPLYASGTAIPGRGVHNVLYVATMHNSVYAFDADDPASGAPLWQTNLGTPVPHNYPVSLTVNTVGNCTLGGSSPVTAPITGGTTLTPEIGILSTPVIDPVSKTIYAVTATLENNNYCHKLHALDMTTGAERPGSPVTIQASVPGHDFFNPAGPAIAFAPVRLLPDNTWVEQIQRAALALVNGKIYVAFAVFHDPGGTPDPWHGWLMAYDANTLQQTGAFATTPAGGGGSIWQSGTGPAADAQGNIYVETGNGDYDGVSNFSDRFLKLSGGLGLGAQYAPADQATLNNLDLDLGVAGPTLLSGSNLLVGGSKNGTLYLLDSGLNLYDSFTAALPCAVPLSWDTCSQVRQYAYWSAAAPPVLYIWASPIHQDSPFSEQQQDMLRAYRVDLNAMRFNRAPASIGTITSAYPGGMLALSANGNVPGSGIVWAATTTDSAESQTVAGTLRAFDASDVSHELWNSDMNAGRDSLGNLAKFALPTVANGKVYVPTFSYVVNVYGLLPHAALAISKTHTGDFMQGQQGAVYTIKVSNAAAEGATAGTVAVADSAPAGLSLASMAGLGWACASNTCTRSDSLPPGQSFPPITVTVNIAANAPAQVTNVATVSGGGATSAAANDVTTIVSLTMPPAAPVLSSPVNAATGVALNATLNWSGAAGATSYDLYFGTSTTPPLLAAFVGTTYAPQLSAGTSYYWRVVSKNAGGSASSPTWTFTTIPPGPATNGLGFYPVTPCRVVDTRSYGGKAGAFGPPFLARGKARDFPIAAGSCAIPATAQAYSLNVTVFPHGPLTFLSIWPAGSAFPTVSTLNSLDGAVVSNAALVPAGPNGAISVFASDDTDVFIDVNGYFAPPDANALTFYPVTPCRIADTRSYGGKSGAFGPPRMQAGETRAFPVPASTCGIPAAAQAYALNITAWPPGSLQYLSTWAAGQAQPFVSTLNAYNGGLVANAAIAPAGVNGGVDLFVTDATDVIIDISGYFAPPGPGGLYFYPLTPCRIADTRSYGGKTGAFGPPGLTSLSTRSFPVAASSCNVPAPAQAYSLNMTAWPPGPLTFLSTWPAGQPQPLVSTLNSLAGRVVANAAIVPAGTNGAISVFVSEASDLFFDINGYFAP